MAKLLAVLPAIRTDSLVNGSGAPLRACVPPRAACRLVSASAILVLLLSSGGELRAQDPPCKELLAGTTTAGAAAIEGECIGPTVTISPDSHDTSSSTLSVTIIWDGNGRPLDTSTRSITLNGSSVESSFTHSPTISTGTISLASGGNVLDAWIENTDGISGSATAFYYRDTVSPVVEVDPSGGYFRNSSLGVSVASTDDRRLDGSSRTLTLNGSSVASSYSGDATSASSSATLTLGAADIDVFWARICDEAGNCRAEDANYIYDPTRPGVSISPSGGTFSDASRPVTIEWSDDWVLDGSSRTITLNGSSVKGSFGYSGGGGSATSSGSVTLVPGSNTLTARICDEAGNCRTENASYTYNGSPTYAVSVTPDGPDVPASPNASTTQVFTVRNLGSDSASFALEVSCAGTADACSASAGSLSLAEGASASVSVDYSVGASGTAGTVQLAARDDGHNVRDAGLINVHVYDSNDLSVEVESANPGTALARGLCVTIAVAPASVSECGDLRITHPLPSTRTLNKVRTPVLLYNSQHAHPYPAVAAHVTLPETASATDSVVAILRLGSAVRARKMWPDSQWSAGATRRITLAFDGLNDPTGLYAYTVEVLRWSGATPDFATASGDLVIVNRKDSPFGAGWWLAGLERIIGLGGSKKLWIGGDGSVRVYTPTSTNVWVAPALTRPDTLEYDGTYFTRVLPGGDTVRYNAAGRHVATTNRLGHRTRFQYRSDGRLNQVFLPVPPGAESRYYEFDHDSNGRVVSIEAPRIRRQWPDQDIERITNITLSGGNLTSVRDPGQPAVHYDYHNGRMRYRTDRRDSWVEYAFDAAGKLSQVRRYMSGLSAGPNDLITNISTVEARSLATALVPDSAYTRLDGPRTDVSDYTDFHPNRWGAPKKITNALGGETLLQRTDGRFPALVTRVAYPVLEEDGTRRVQLASYDARGNLESVTEVAPYGDGRNATTRYGYDDPDWPDFVTRIVPPMGDSVVIGYDADGNRHWQQDARGPSSRTYFHYHDSGPGAGLLAAVDPPLAPPDSLFYDDDYGNLSRTKSAMGFVTEYLKDDIGRDTLVTGPIEGAERVFQRIAYDEMGRDTLVMRWGPAQTYRLSISPAPLETVPAETLFVRTYYDPEGNPTRVLRFSGASTEHVGLLETVWSYDAAGRVESEEGPYGTESYAYDPAGNLKSRTTERGLTLTMRYDALGRLVERVVPAVDHAPSTCAPHWDTPCFARFPLYPNNSAGGLTVPADTQRYAYDAAGNLTAADNRDARVRRTYYRNGLLESDTLRIRRYSNTDPDDCGGGPDCDGPDPELLGAASLGAGAVTVASTVASTVADAPGEDIDFSIQVFGLRYGYDANGRRRWMEHPGNLLPAGAADSVAYTYHPWGALASVRSVLGHLYRYDYDLAGRLVRLRFPGGGVDTLAYDPDGRVVWRNEYTSAATLREDTIGYDARGKVRWVAGANDTVSLAYSALGSLAALDWRTLPLGSMHITEEWRSDALGHVKWHRLWNAETMATPRTRYYDYGAGGRVEAIRTPPDPIQLIPPDSTYSLADAGGNVRHWGERQYTIDHGDYELDYASAATSYWSADERLYVQQKYGDPDDAYRAGVYEEYRYDALGRRVLVRARTDSLCAVLCYSAIERTVWDGDQLLYEIRSPGGNEVSDGGLESNHTSGGTQYGRVTYLHGPGIDRPLEVIRSGYESRGPFAFLPHANWRGFFDSASRPDGTRYEECDTCMNVLWPGKHYRAYYDPFAGALPDWMGSLVTMKRDLSGQLYMRNRYYNPETGQFTQQDPIGIAGGMNLYGFASGDPVNFSDPFGLCPEDAGGDGKTEDFDDCPEGSSGWYAHRLATGEGNEFLNTAGGVLASCGESTLCMGVLAVASLGAGAAAGVAGSGATEAAVATRTAGNTITGYTRHGLNQAISRDGAGVATKAILDAVRSPVRVIQQAGGKVMYVGQNARVVLNQAGKVITTWATSRAGWRIIP